MDTRAPLLQLQQEFHKNHLSCLLQTCTIGMSMDADINMRSRRRWKKGHVYIHCAKSVSEPLTRLPCPCNAVISVFRNGAVTPILFLFFISNLLNTFKEGVT